MNSLIEEFENKFQKDETEMYILTESEVRSAGVGDGFFIPSVNFIASADVQTGEVTRERGDISWISPGEGMRSEWISEIEKLKVYRIKARRSLSKVMNDYISVRYNSYMLTEIMESDAGHSGLQEIADEYIKARKCCDGNSVENFKMSRDFGGYTGFADWMGSKCMITLEFDPETEKADLSYSYFKKFCSLLPQIDDVMRMAAASEYAGYCSGRKIPAEDAALYLSVTDIDVSSTGDITVYYENDSVHDGVTAEVHVRYNGTVLYTSCSE